MTDRNPKLFLPVRLVQPSPVEMEHVSTTPDIAKSGFARGILVQRSKMAILGNRVPALFISNPAGANS
jgi:hypothetical protein